MLRLNSSSSSLKHLRAGQLTPSLCEYYDLYGSTAESFPQVIKAKATPGIRTLDLRTRRDRPMTTEPKKPIRLHRTSFELSKNRKDPVISGFVQRRQSRTNVGRSKLVEFLTHRINDRRKSNSSNDLTEVKLIESVEKVQLSADKKKLECSEQQIT